MNYYDGNQEHQMATTVISLYLRYSETMLRDKCTPYYLFYMCVLFQSLSKCINVQNKLFFYKTHTTYIEIWPHSLFGGRTHKWGGVFF